MTDVREMGEDRKLIDRLLDVQADAAQKCIGAISAAGIEADYAEIEQLSNIILARLARGRRCEAALRMILEGWETARIPRLTPAQFQQINAALAPEPEAK